MSLCTAVSRFFNEGLFEGNGPLVLHVTKGTLHEQPIPMDELRGYKDSVLEKILAGEGANTPNALRFSQVYMQEPLATGKEKYLKDLENIREKAKNESKPEQAYDHVDFNTIRSWALLDLIKKCDTYRSAPYIAIKDGPLVLYLGEERGISDGDTMLVNGIPADLGSKPAITLARMPISINYRGSESSISYGDPVHCLKNIYEGGEKFQFSTSLWTEGYGSDSRIFTVTRIGHNNFEIYSKKGKRIHELASGSWHMNDEIIAAHAQK